MMLGLLQRLKCLLTVIVLTLPSLCRADEAAALKLLQSLGGTEEIDKNREDKPVVGMSLRGPKIDDLVMESVIELKQLRVLRLSSAEISDEGLKRLAALPALNVLSLNRCRISDDGLMGLASLTNLQLLDVRATRAFTSKPSKPIFFPALKTLQISASNDLNLDALAVLSELRELHIVGGAGLGTYKVELSKLKSLKNLKTLTLTYLRETVLKDLDQLPGLESLDLSGGGWYLANSGHVLTEAGLGQLKSLTKLHSLDLSGREVSAAGYKMLSQLTQLKRLNLRGSNISDAALNDLRELKSLDALDVDRADVTEAGVRELRAALPNTNIIFQVPKQTPEAKAAMKELGKLGAIYQQSIQAATGDRSVVFVGLSGKNVGDLDLVHLKAFTELNSLDLSRTQITDGSLETLLSLSNLLTLKLNNTKITDAGVQQLSKLSNLTNLELAGIPITDSGLKKLQELKSMKKLTIEGVSVSEECIAETKSALPKLVLTVRE